MTTQKKKEPLWNQVKSNLWRNRDSGKYYARTNVEGKDLWKSLKTDSPSVAELRLPTKLAQMRAAAKAKVGFRIGDELTLMDCEEIYKKDLQENKDLKPEAVEYRISTLVGIRNTFDGFDNFHADRINEDICQLWAKRARARYSAPRFNGMLQTFRAVMEIAVSRGCVSENPFKIANIKQARVITKAKPVYSFEQMDLLFEELKRRAQGPWGGMDALWFCRFLYHFSLRVNTARHLTPAMANRAAKRFEIPGQLVKRGREGTIVYVPIFPEMEGLLKEMDSALGAQRPKLLPTLDCRGTLRRACEHIKLPVLNHHSFRHIFTTHALLRGAPVPTLAKWRNDADGGAFLLKHYSHVIDEYSREQAAKLKFRTGRRKKIHVLKTAAGK